MTGLSQDLRAALRMLARRPGFTAASILTLALGIGGATTMYGFLQAVVRQSRPTVPEPERVARVFATTSPQDDTRGLVTFGDYRRWREAARSFESLAAHTSQTLPLQTPEGTEEVGATWVTPSYLSVLETPPVAGRFFTEEESRARGGGLALLSERAWRSRFGGDPSAVGRPLELDGKTYTVVGVMPERLGLVARGMGSVYRARDHELGREVALKVLSADLAGDQAFMQRFRREARVLAALDHPNIAALYELLEAEGRTHLVLELVEGETLGDRLSRGPLFVDQALALALQIADGVSEAHRKGIVHRDLKPANVRLTPEGRVKILDFGLAKGPSEEGDTSFVTESGVRLGTAPYMSPEQVRGDDVDERTDVWAVGCLLYEMLTGRRAFSGRGGSDVLAAILRDDVDWDRLPRSTPRDVRRLLRRCLRKDPARRVQHIGDVALELAEARAAEGGEAAGPERSRWASLLGGGV